MGEVRRTIEADNVCTEMATVKRSTLVAAGLGALLAWLAAAPAWATTYVVNTTADPAGAGCTGGACSLRQAADAVSSGAGTGDTINLPAGHYVLSLGSTVTISKPATIAGAGARSTILDANSTSAVLTFDPGAVPSAITGLTVTGGRSFGPGGIYNDATLTIRDSTVSGNVATSSTGGGVYNNSGRTLTIDRSTISGNSASTVGGGVYNQGTLTITNSTIAGNTADTSASNWEAGGLYSDDTATITNSTITGNTAAQGGGVDTGGGSTTNFKNTIVAANTATGAGPANCSGSGTFTSQGSNLEDADSCSFIQASDLRNTPASLGLPGNNGGPTDTWALLFGSAAIDRASGCPTTDQRGVSRPQNGICDIGAYEFAPPGVTTGSASARNTAGGSVSGTVQPNLRATGYHFDYGSTTAYGSGSAVQSAGVGNTPVAVNATFTGLRAGTTYHYRLVATNADGTTVGSDRTFTTAKFSGASLASRTLRIDAKGRVKLRLRCPATTAGGKCLTVAGLYKKKGRLPVSVSKRRKARRLARGRLSVTAGKTRTKRIRLNKAGRRLSKRSQTFRARLLLTSRDSAGNAKTRSYKVKVKRTRRPRHSLSG
jgi:hypothetical protein